jgi:phosphoglycolate phosphatase-like HAD superfamily hydrolase
MTVLFWDIDGTLLTTGRAGMFAWSDSVRELTGREFDLRTEFRTAGLTDYQIAVRTLEKVGWEPHEARVRALLTRYEELLPGSLPLKNGYVLPNVREILEHLAGRPDVRSYLLTGNTREGARAKLTYYGLIDFFPDGAFAEDTSDRATIAARALQLARRAGPIADNAAFVIGDTPHDIHCATAIGARTIAVATGGYSTSELAEHRPWRVFEELPGVDEFMGLIGDAAVRLEPDTETVRLKPDTTYGATHGGKANAR